MNHNIDPAAGAPGEKEVLRLVDAILAKGQPAARPNAPDPEAPHTAPQASTAPAEEPEQQAAPAEAPAPDAEGPAPKAEGEERRHFSLRQWIKDYSGPYIGVASLLAAGMVFLLKFWNYLRYQGFFSAYGLSCQDVNHTSDMGFTSFLLLMVGALCFELGIFLFHIAFTLSVGFSSRRLSHMIGHSSSKNIRNRALLFALGISFFVFPVLAAANGDLRYPSSTVTMRPSFWVCLNIFLYGTISFIVSFLCAIGSYIALSHIRRSHTSSNAASSLLLSLYPDFSFLRDHFLGKAKHLKATLLSLFIKVTSFFHGLLKLFSQQLHAFSAFLCSFQIFHRFFHSSFVSSLSHIQCTTVQALHHLCNFLHRRYHIIKSLLSARRRTRNQRRIRRWEESSINIHSLHITAGTLSVISASFLGLIFLSWCFFAYGQYDAQRQLDYLIIQEPSASYAVIEQSEEFYWTIRAIPDLEFRTLTLDSSIRQTFSLENVTTQKIHFDQVEILFS